MQKFVLVVTVSLLASGCLLGSGELSIEKSEDPVVIDTADTSDTSDPSDPSGPTTNPPPNTGGPAPVTPPQTDPSCPTGQNMCGGVCTDVLANDANCGDCDVACDGGTVCMNGGCECEMGSFCGGACVDTTTSLQHCGDCDQPCAGGTACVGGNCMAVSEVEGVLIAANAARAAGANCGGQQFAPTSPLEGDPNLHLAAQVHADDMATNDFFSHTGSDGSSFDQRIRRTNFAGQPLGENIAAGGREAAGVVQRWIDSPGHCSNMMNPNATKLGVGYAPGGPYGTSWVQVFGR